MNRLKRFLCSLWTIGIGTTVIAGIILKLTDNIVRTTLVSTILQFLIQVTDFLRRFFIFKIPIWSILVSFGIAFALVKRKSKSKTKSPNFIHYTEDIFEDTLYKWEYIYNNKEYHIGKIVDYCPACGFRIIHHECQKCKNFFINNKTREQIEAFIRFNIQKKFSVNEFNAIK